jgi:hypothetical protein
VHREDEKGLVTTDPIGIGRMAGAIVLPVLLIAVIVTGAAGVYFLVDRWESRPIQIAVLAVFLFVVELFVEW